MAISLSCTPSYHSVDCLVTGLDNQSSGRLVGPGGDYVEWSNETSGSFSHTFTGLESNHSYTCVAAQTSPSSSMSTARFTTLDDTPSITFNINSSETTSTSIYITSIQKSNGTSYYLVYRKSSESKATEVPLGSGTTKRIDGLDSSTSYVFNAYATDSQGTRYYTYTSDPPTETTKSESYISFSARSDSPTSIIVYPITAIGCNPTTYTIFCRETGQTVAQEITISASSLDPNNPPKFSGLTTGTSYILNVRGTTRSGAQIWAQNTQTVIAGSSISTYIYYDGRWRLAQPYIYYNNQWRMAQAYIYYGSKWRPA